MLIGIKNEFNKSFWENKILIVLVLFMVAQVILAVSESGTNTYKNNSKADKTINSYYEKWGGKLNDEKIKEIEDYYEQINNAYNDSSILYEKLENGVISQEEFKNSAKKVSELIEQRHIFEEFYGEYQYVKKDVNHRMLIRADGWKRILNSNINYVVVLIVIFISAMTVSCDNKGTMKVLISTTKKGRKFTGISKLLYIYFFVTVLNIIEILIKMLYLLINGFHFDYGNAYIQSIQMFENSGTNITLLQFSLLVYCIKIIGGIYLASITAFIAEINKKGFMAICISVAITLLPLYMLEDSELLFKIPLPTGMLIGTDYILKNHIYNYGINFAVFIGVCVFTIVYFRYAYCGLLRKRQGWYYG